MESFDKTTGSYGYSEESNGRALDQDQLVRDLMKAVEGPLLQTQVQAVFQTVAPKRTRAQAKEQYKVIGTFATTTTNNKNRNQNIRLAAEAIDGMILKPGQEFSFNMTTGNRTSDKGYQPAGANRAEASARFPPHCTMPSLIRDLRQRNGIFTVLPPAILKRGRMPWSVLTAMRDRICGL